MAVAHASRAGLLLVNLGTPRAPRPREVRRYLREFLSDPRVLDVPALVRWLVLELAILPFRPRRSAAAYAKIWTAEGSPLLVHGRALAAKVAERLGDGAAVELAMRYGEPSITDALARLHARGVRRLVVFPLYPEWSASATGSALEAVFRASSRFWDPLLLHVVPPFFDDPRYLACVAEIAAPILREAKPEFALFSFHGLPERQIRKSDPTGRWCLSRADCCDRAAEAGVLASCYRAQCFAAAALLAERLEVPAGRRRVSFQSRLGRTPWIRPFTDLEVRAAARRGVERLVVLSPAFVADCLETLEEIGLRAADDFRAHGGKSLRLVPSLNARESWVDTVVAIARDASPWLVA